MNVTTFTRRSVAALALGGALLASTANLSLAEANNSKIMIGFTPKFLKDDFQTLMLQLSLKAFADKGMTVVGSPDPNGDIVNFKGQRIPFSEYSTLLNRQGFVYDRAKARAASDAR